MENETEILLKALSNCYEIGIRRIYMTGVEDGSQVTFEMADKDNLTSARFICERKMFADYSLKSGWITPELKKNV